MDSSSNNTIGKEDQAIFLNVEMNHVYDNLSKSFVQLWIHIYCGLTPANN